MRHSLLLAIAAALAAGGAFADEPAEYQNVVSLESLEWMLGEWSAPLPDGKGRDLVTWRRGLQGTVLVGEFREQRGAATLHVATAIVMPTPGENTVTHYMFHNDLSMTGSLVLQRGNEFRWDGVRRMRGGQVWRGRLQQQRESEDVYTAQLLIADKQGEYSPIGPLVRMVREGGSESEPSDMPAAEIAETNPEVVLASERDELAALAGEYERYWGPEPQRRQVKRIEGSTETIVFYDQAGQELDRHTVSISVSRQNGVRVLTHPAVMAAGPNETISYVYSLNEGDFIEARGLHKDDPLPPNNVRWKRISPALSEKAAR
ncbi:hypothetical protein [Botrimarina hoheduenensis]|uniref:Lipocalin-like domain-containing protein n=1 Tax=Botrimarina hoheduenensis TaxID=2528000 RepID=A0A5C5WEC0_9BACT|nr:hypothetical protein [Botrimarina hoheduenensis]TWT48960.1 hypothetical protein Pla111_07380 [Botrimarina hoheduenensis]